MRRLLSTIRTDVRLQYRNGFYAAALFVTVVWIIVASQAPKADYGWLLPVLLLNNLIVGTFYFLGGLLLLEKREGTLEAQIVTPLRTWEYLSSKVITLTALALVENVVIVAVLYGFGFQVLPLLAGAGCAAMMYTLLGFVAVARYDSINEYLFPSVLYTALLVLPLLDYFGLWTSWIYFAHPLQAPLRLMRAAFEPIAGWQLLALLLYSILWIVVILFFSQKIFHRFIVRKEGV